MIKVLIVDDSEVFRLQLSYILNSQPGIQVIGKVGHGKGALDFVKVHKPHVITMDIHMPGMDGFATTRSIMESYPLPIVIVSAKWEPLEVATTFKAMEAGAVMILRKPAFIKTAEGAQEVAELIAAIKQAATIKVRRLRSQKRETLKGGKELKRRELNIIALGASTGGPVAIKDFLTLLPMDFPVPILIVQHIAPGFMAGFTEWLKGHSTLPIELAKEGQPISKGHIYVAPEDVQMGVNRSKVISLTPDPPEHSIRPSVSYLFRTVAKVYKSTGAGVLLSGMGADGALELKLIKDQGGITFVQNQETSVVHGMPSAAIRLGAHHYVLSPREIALTLLELVMTKGG